MSLAILAIASALIGGQGTNFATTAQSVTLAGMDTSRHLATIRPYPVGRADDVRRPGFNGRLWIGEINIGPENHSWPMGFGDPGPMAYGAAGHEFDRAYAKIGCTAVGISPWIAFNGSGMGDFEMARNEWLRERGYVGGVRTFVNDLYLPQYMEEHPMAMASKIEPRGTIQLPDDMPRFKSRQHVMHEAGTVQQVSIGKVSLPPQAGKALVLRIEQMRVQKESKVASK